MNLTKDEKNILGYLLGELNAWSRRLLEARLEQEPDFKALFEKWKKFLNVHLKEYYEKEAKALKGTLAGPDLMLSKVHSYLDATGYHEPKSSTGKGWLEHLRNVIFGTPKPEVLMHRNFRMDRRGAGLPFQGFAASKSFLGATAGIMKSRKNIIECCYDAGLPTEGMPSPSEACFEIPPMDADLFKEHEKYQNYREHIFQGTRENPLSTFSLDVDTASWSNIRRYVQEMHQLPPKDAVRLEEMLNYFRYTLPQPEEGKTFGCTQALTECPWNPAHKLLRLAIQTKRLQVQRPAANIVFLIDVSGSMSDDNKLPLVKKSIENLRDHLRADDTISLVTYSDVDHVLVDGVRGTDWGAVQSKLDPLEANGGTYGSKGLEMAYSIAIRNFKRDGINRIILCTDGDFNFGLTTSSDLSSFIKQKSKSGVSLTILGFGMGNYHDENLKTLSKDGHGNYAYIDRLPEARRVLVEQLESTMVTVARDAKVQVEFNPANVAAYRQIGYECRKLEARDFNDDKKEAADIGAGHSITVLYELIPAGCPIPGASVDALKYQTPAQAGTLAGELATVKMRYKEPKSITSDLLVFEPVQASAEVRLANADEDTRFAAAVAAAGMSLRGSPFLGDLEPEDVLRLAESAVPENASPERLEFLAVVREAAVLK